MSGLEAAAVTLGPKALASLAGKAAGALSHRFLFRFRVSRRARKAVDFPCPGRSHRKWLKTLTAVEIGQPVEAVAAELAVRLDAELTAASAEWAQHQGHLSRALRLVEQTFPAIAAELKDRDYRQTSEQWAQERSSKSREQLFLLAGPDAGMSAFDLASVLLRRSSARRSVRLQASGLNEYDLAAYFARVQAPEVPRAALRVLVGDFGSGKSEKAESWHRACIQALIRDASAPLPAWLGARDLNSPALESALDAQVGNSWRSGRGACLVVDGLDETSVATAHAVLENARMLVNSHNNVRVLLTARAGVLSPEGDEEVPVALLGRDEALSLVGLAGGDERATWSWADGMRESVRRPFFALAAGAMLGAAEAPRNEADLIRALVERALGRGSDRARLTSTESYRALKKLAVALTEGGTAGRLTFSERQQVLSSSLVTDGPNDAVGFSLPIFQQWFAAQAMLEGDVLGTRAIEDMASFDRWQWASAIAVLSLQDPAALDDLIGAWVTGNPGVAGWVLDQAFGSGRVWREAPEPIDASGAGERLLRALRTWSDALGSWSPCVLPPMMSEGPFGLGVRVEGHQLAIGLNVDYPDEDYVAELPGEIHPFARVSNSDWLPWFFGPVPEGPAWPWLVARDKVSTDTARALERHPYLGGKDSVWQEERFYDIARQITGNGSMVQRPLPSDEVRTAATTLLQRVNADGTIRLDSQIYDAQELVDLTGHLDQTQVTALPFPLPAGDVENPTSGRVWDLYSHERLMHFEVEAYGRACVAYDEAMAHAFANFGWAMQGAALGSMGVLLELEYRDGFGEDSPGLTLVRMPIDLLHEMTPTGPEVVWSDTGRAVISPAPEGTEDSWARHHHRLERVRAWLAEHGIESPGSLGWTNTMADDMAKRRPSVAIAAGWLFHDLKALGLASGTSPQFHSL